MMKKDIFNGNIKHEYTSYIWTSIFVWFFIFIGCGSLFLYLSLSGGQSLTDSILFWAVSVVAYLLSIFYPLFTIFVIRNYPKYPKLRKLCLNSDYYFVGQDSRAFHGHPRGKPAFEMAARFAEQNKGLENIKYPKKYRICIVLVVIGIVFLFANPIAAYIVLKNIAALPEAIQNEGAVFAIFIIAEILYMVLSFVFAFRVKKIREITIKEYRKSDGYRR